MTDTQSLIFSYIHIWKTKGYYKVFLHNNLSRCNRKFKQLKEAVRYAQEHSRYTIHLHDETGKVIQEIRPKLKAITHN